MRNLPLRKRDYLIPLLPLAIIISFLGSINPKGIESVYSNGIYKFVAQVMSNITGIIPISISEIIILSLIAFSIYQVIKLIINIKNTKDNRLAILVRFFISVIVVLSIIYFTFMLAWGLNYHRLPLADIVGFEMIEYDSNDLADLAEYLIFDANELRQKVKFDEYGIMTLGESPFSTMKRSNIAFEEAGKLYPELGGNYGKPKVLLLSRSISYLGIWGFYFPFTFEANVNVNIPDSMIPSTAIHEIAHQRGFAREDEADYIAYLVSRMHPDYDYQYSGTLMALRHVMNALARTDYERFLELRETYSAGVLKDMQAITVHNQRHSGFISNISAEVNNAYLKANAQKDGIQSYGRMIDLLMAQYKTETDESSR